MAASKKTDTDQASDEQAQAREVAAEGSQDPYKDVVAMTSVRADGSPDQHAGYEVLGEDVEVKDRR